MGLYSHWIFPRLCDLLLGSQFVGKYREGLLASVGGNVLEIGFGTGLNLPYYPKEVRKITVVDPNTGMHRLARKRIRDSGIEVDQRVLSSERLPFEDKSFDCVVSTFTLCSIDDVTKALSEVHRALKPGGCFLFLEHGLSPDSGVQKWQHRLNWLQMRLGDGCQLDRDMGQLIAAQPFRSVEIEKFYMEKMPKTHGYAYRGIATK